MDLQTPEVTLNVVEDGDPEAPPVLILHGITQSTATWGWLVPELVERFRVLRLDFRGHGRSGRTPGRYTFPAYIADATAVCEQVAGRPCVVVGHSLGGGTALGLAQQRPDLVAALVCEDPATATAGAEADLEGNSLLEGFALLRESVPGFQAAGMSTPDLADALRVAPTTKGPTMGEVLHADAIEAMAEGLLQLDASVLDPVLTGTSGAPYDSAEPITRPGIVLAADPTSPDAVARPDALALLAEHSPALEARTVAGAGHLIHDSKEHRQAVLDAVLEVVAGPREHA